ncbi:ATP-binding cassette sub-family G member 1-like [Thrips palmi]|uniref:ATP-binding cassette sub-family G member 1-like n=1 Tax=Thrips palmi TaxID=161013 RepID=A0A6P8Z1X1_THRPL|nr:ATP-binding cassette sub-family G member 1-like [Thrips palmi]
MSPRGGALLEMAPAATVTPSQGANGHGVNGNGVARDQSLRLRLDFKISYVVPEKKSGSGPREILKDVRGCLRPGRLTAILGPSGTGKTSCLSILTGQRAAGVQGRVLVNGEERSPASYRNYCVLIAQEMSLLNALTARETLRIAADLKLPSNKHSCQQRDDVVADIARTLGLEACLDTSVAHLSGGEKKRLSIGIELVTNPPIMFFDEPTSGLDSVSSLQVVSHLRTLALEGRTVAVVLHQPSSRLFRLFDDVIVLGGGRSLYCGAVSEAASTFSAAGFTCPTFYNIADYVVEVASGEHGTEMDALYKAIDADVQPALEAVEDVRSGEAGEADALVRPRGVALDVEGAAPPCCSGYPVSFWVQFAVLFKRSLVVSWRDMNMAWLRLAVHLIVGLILGFLYQDVGNEASKISGNVACIFFFVLFLFFSNALPTVLTFPLEAAVFFREYSNNWYSMPAYYLSKVLADFPYLIVNPTVFVLVAYYMTDQPTQDLRPVLVWFVCVLIVFTAHAYGLLFGAAMGMQLAVFFVPASTIPLVLFSGFFLHIPDIPSLLRWLSYVSNFRYGFEGLAVAIYGMDRKPMNCAIPYCHWRRPSKILEDVGMLHSNYWTDVTGLLVWLLCLHVGLLITLKVKVILSRR